MTRHVLDHHRGDGADRARRYLDIERREKPHGNTHRLMQRDHDAQARRRFEVFMRITRTQVTEPI